MSMHFAHMYPERILRIQNFVAVHACVQDGIIFVMLRLHVTECLVPAGGCELADDANEAHLMGIPPNLAIDFSFASSDIICNWHIVTTRCIFRITINDNLRSTFYYWLLELTCFSFFIHSSINLFWKSRK